MKDALFCSTIIGNTIKLDSKVIKVTIFNDRAEVTRKVVTKLEKGKCTLKFTALPDSIDESSIRVEGKGAIVLKDVAIKKIFLTDIYQKKSKELHLKKDDILDKLKIVKDNIKRVKKEQVLIDNIVKKVTTTSNDENSNLLGKFNIENWTKVINFYRKKLEDLDSEHRELSHEKDELDKKYSKISDEIRNNGYLDDKYNYDVDISVEVKENTKIKLFLSYMTTKAKWTPIYDIRVNSNNKVINLSYNAFITQSSGEDWNQVSLKLSTAKPSIGGSHPILEPWYISEYSPPLKHDYLIVNSLRNNAPIINDTPITNNSPVTDEYSEVTMREDNKQKDNIEQERSKVDKKISSAIFTLNQKATIPSDNTPHKVNIMIKPFKAYFRYSTVPILSAFAYLKVNITNDSDYPLIAGKTNIYLDSNFIANSKIKTVSSGESFWVFLGVDEDIEVKYKKIAKIKNTIGIINKNNTITYEYKTEIINNKKNNIELIYWDRMPISNDKKIKVKLIEPTYNKKSKTLIINDKKMIEWVKKIKSKEKIIIPFKFKVIYPHDIKVNL
jgi:uncharacterized protein (TIGR02231 family)